MKRSLVLLTFSLAGLTVSVHAGVISLNLNQYYRDKYMIDADETYGLEAEGGHVGGWMNVSDLTAGKKGLRLRNGLATAVDASFTAPEGLASFGAVFDNTVFESGMDDYPWTDSPTTMTLSGLNRTFEEGYKVIVYIGGFKENTGASISDGTTTYYFQTKTHPTRNHVPVQMTDTVDDGEGTSQEAEYAIFGSDEEPLTLDTLTLTLNAMSGSGVGLGGIQIIGPVPVPVELIRDGGSDPQVRFAGESGQPYEVQASSTLEAGSWTTLDWGVVPAPAEDGPIVVDDTDGMGPGTRFYRAKEVRPVGGTSGS